MPVYAWRHWLGCHVQYASADQQVILTFSICTAVQLVVYEYMSTAITFIRLDPLDLVED